MFSHPYNHIHHRNSFHPHCLMDPLLLLFHWCYLWRCLLMFHKPWKTFSTAAAFEVSCRRIELNRFWMFIIHGSSFMAHHSRDVYLWLCFLRFSWAVKLFPTDWAGKNGISSCCFYVCFFFVTRVGRFSFTVVTLTDSSSEPGSLYDFSGCRPVKILFPHTCTSGQMQDSL